MGYDTDDNGDATLAAEPSAWKARTPTFFKGKLKKVGKVGVLAFQADGSAASVASPFFQG